MEETGSDQKKGNKFCSSTSLIQSWRIVYKLHVIDGLLNKSGAYSGEFKKTVLEYMKQNKLSLTETTRYSKFQRYQQSNSAGIWKRKKDVLAYMKNDADDIHL